MDDDAKDGAPATEFNLNVPGFGLALNHMPPRDECFPVLDGDEDSWKAKTLLIREVCMLKLVEDITNKPEWWRKVRDPEIAAKWKKEAVGMPWGEYLEHADFTPDMAEYCIQELRLKADFYEKTNLIPVFDYSETVIKSDSLIPAELWKELSDGVKPLEDVSEESKDWHPGSNKQVLDLVHPSLWPLVYGRSRVLPSRRIGVRDALQNCGLGELAPIPAGMPRPEISKRFQWLPCDVSLNQDGKAGIESYINNLHPVEHATLYPVIEKFIEKSLPAWDAIYRWEHEFERQRLKAEGAYPECTTPAVCKDKWECRPPNRPVDADEDPREEDEEDLGDYEDSERQKRDMAWFLATHPPNLPDIAADQSQFDVEPSDILTKGFFDEKKQIQVIVKLANIELTPENSVYPGGTWHIEGQQNEHICATALFYYDCENISDSYLSFRTRADAEELSTSFGYAQNDDLSIERTLAIQSSGSTLQHIGRVLTRQHRAVFFPNVYMHQVQPFELVDRSKRGHRKILALFLVDPAIPILSTSNVPPQQTHWWKGEEAIRSSGRLPPEIADMVMQNVDFLIDEKEAKELREELMSERSGMQATMGQNLEWTTWNFCEH